MTGKELLKKYKEPKTAKTSARVMTAKIVRLNLNITGLLHPKVDCDNDFDAVRAGPDKILSGTLCLSRNERRY